MAEGGFLVKFDGEKPLRCYAVSFDWDLWEMRVNNEKKGRELPQNLATISIEIEEE